MYDMSSISKAGIFVDVKQLMPFTQKMNKEMCVAVLAQIPELENLIFAEYNPV